MTTYVHPNAPGFVLSVSDAPTVDRWGHVSGAYGSAAPARAKAVKSLAFLGPWCPNCGKALKTAKDVSGRKCSNAEKCFDAQWKRAFKGCPSHAGTGERLLYNTAPKMGDPLPTVSPVTLLNATDKVHDAA